MALKKFAMKYSGVMAALALFVATTLANSTCIFYAYQDEMPETAKKLRKF